MDPNTLAATLTQFGVAGLMGWMWLSERRAAAERDRHLAQAHERIAQDRVAMNAVLEALRDNTRVLGGVESTLRGLASDISYCGNCSRSKQKANKTGGKCLDLPS